MKNLSITTVIEKNKLDSDRAWLIALKIHVRDPRTNAIVEVVRVVNNDEVTVIKGEEYEPFPFDIDITERANELPSVTVTIQDQTQIVQSYMDRYQGAVGSDVDLIIVHASTANDAESDPELTEFFKILNSSVANYVVSWTLGAENPLTMMFPARKQEEDTCPWRFRDSNCGYKGSAASCDLSLNGPNGCRAKGNQANFGGYPGIMARG